MAKREPVMQPSEPAVEATRARCLRVALTEEALSEVDALCRQTGRSRTDLLRLSMGLLRFAVVEKEKGNRFAVVAPDGRVTKELVLPR